MSLYAHLAAALPGHLDALSAALAAADQPGRPLCAVKIQRLYRGHVVRSHVATSVAAAGNITRLFRGHRARNRKRKLHSSREHFSVSLVHHISACVAQRTFRGFYSRRYLHDYSARRTYIESILVKGTRLREALATQLNHQLASVAEKERVQASDEFESLSRGLHHLISTKAIAGIYNSPYAAEVPCVSGVPIEHHLHAASRQQRQASTGAAPPPPALGRSLQAQSAYGEVTERARVDSKLQKLMMIGAQDFRGGQRVNEPPYSRGVNSGSQYTDPWRNPYLTRGIPASEDDLRQRRPALGRAPDVPFYTVVGGNQHSVYPNDRFDVIAHSAEGKARTLRDAVSG